MNNLDLFNKPLKSYLIYQGMLLVIGFFIITITSFLIKFNAYRVLIGYFTGCIAITLGFIIIIYSADKVLMNANNEKHAKNINLLYFVFRYFLYIAICGFSIRLFDANILAIVVGMFSLKVIIFIDNILYKNGGEN